MSAGAVLGFCCARHPSASTIRDRVDTSGECGGVGMQELERITARRSELDTLTEELAKRLQTWRTLQIEYYNDRQLHLKEYPPILAD